MTKLLLDHTQVITRSLIQSGCMCMSQTVYWIRLGKPRFLGPFLKCLLVSRALKFITPRRIKQILAFRMAFSQVKVKHKPRLLSDNGPSYLSKELKDYLEDHQIGHTRGAPFHPMTQGKIERYHRSMKNVVKLQNYYYPGDLEQEINRFVEYYNYQRYHESLNNLTPADVYYGRSRDILSRRKMTKHNTMKLRKQQNLSVIVWAILTPVAYQKTLSYILTRIVPIVLTTYSWFDRWKLQTISMWIRYLFPCNHKRKSTYLIGAFSISNSRNIINVGSHSTDKKSVL